MKPTRPGKFWKLGAGAVMAALICGVPYAGADEEVDTMTMPLVEGASGWVILCGLKVHYPHRSETDPSLVDVKALIDCTDRVQALSMTLGLYRSGFEWGPPRTNGNEWEYRLNSKVFGQCESGDYQGIMDFSITYPMGFRRIRDKGTFIGRSAYVACASAGGGEGGGEGSGGGSGGSGGGGDTCLCDDFEMPCALCSGGSET